MFQQLVKPWVVQRFRRGDTEVSLVWRDRSPLFLLLALVVAEILFPSRVWITSIVALVVILAAAAMWAWQMVDGVHVRRKLRFSWVQVGDLLEERFTIVNDAALPVLWVEIGDTSTIPGYSADTVRTVSGRSVYYWVTRGECRLRGEYHLGPWKAATGDLFGIFAVEQLHHTVQTVLVYPPIARRLPFSLPRGVTAGRASTSQRSWEVTVNAGGVRAFVPGDPRHHIHWPTSARRQQLYAKEFDQETGGDIWLVLDMDPNVQVGSGERSTAELGVIVAGSAAALLLDGRRAVGLLAYDPERRVVLPARGRLHLWDILRALARTRIGAAPPLSRVLDEAARALPAGATTLVITSCLDPAWVSGIVRLRDRGIGAATVLIDAESFETETAHVESGLEAVRGQARQRFGSTALEGDAVGSSAGRPSVRAEAMRGLLADVGIDTEIIGADTPLVLRPPTGQVRRWEFKVLGTGRALAISTPWGDGS